MSQGLGTISRIFAGFAVWSLALCATHAQEAQPATTSSDPTVAIVIDDTQVRAGDGARIADLVDTLERDVLGSSGTFGVVTVGPSGFISDLTRERRHLREVSEAARAGRLEFKGPASPDKEAAARLVSIERVISGLATRPGAKVVVVVGRAADVAGEQHQPWEALRRDAQSARIAVAWLDLGSGACTTGSSPTDATTLARQELCASLASSSSTSSVVNELRKMVHP